MIINIDGNDYEVQEEVATAIRSLLVCIDDLEQEIKLRDISDMYNIQLN